LARAIYIHRVIQKGFCILVAENLQSLYDENDWLKGACMHSQSELGNEGNEWHHRVGDA
jgi:hypothetical protein